MKILIAEDEQRVRQGLCRLISGLDGAYEVVAQASNGNMALELILQLKPDLVFMDMKMPFMDGLSVIKAVRSRGINTEFVVVSAYADFDLAQQSIELDVAGYLLKPLTKEEAEVVLKKVESRLAGKHNYSSYKEESLHQKYPDVHPLIGKALGIIETGYMGKISQQRLAGELGLTPEYFSYLFAKNIGENFSVFLKKHRIEQAKKLYQSDACSKKDVPYQVGFSDTKYYNKVFRQVTGKTPAEYIAEILK